MRNSGIFKGEICLHFVGDIMLSRNVGRKICELGPEFIISRMKTTLQESDLLCGNLESPISKNAIKTGEFKAPPESIEVIKDFNVVNLANNHIYDCGDEGIEDTIDILTKNEIKYVGIGKTETDAYKPTIFSVMGVQIAIFGCTTEVLLKHRRGHKYYVPFIEDKQIFENIKIIKNKVDFIILLFHGGEEFIQFPSPSIRNGMRELVFYGVDLIVGHHPHVLGGYEKVEGNKLIWYSLGDFIFDSFIEKRRKSGILRVKVKKHSICSFELIPTYIEDSLQVRLANDKLAKIILEGIEVNSKKLQKSNYEKSFKLLYLIKLIKFQVDRLQAILKHEGLKLTIKFLLGHIKYFGYYVSKFIKNKSV